jgi:hypothetical protein
MRKGYLGRVLKDGKEFVSQRTKKIRMTMSFSSNVSVY